MEGKPFKLNAKQLEALDIASGPASHFMAEGGSGSSKTFFHVRNMFTRAIKAPGSRQAILRFRFNHVVDSVGRETIPDVMRLAFPGLPVHIDKQNWIYTIEHKNAMPSQIYLGGLDDKERIEKILGKGMVTCLLNECSQIPWAARQLVVTRMRQQVIDTITGNFMKVRMFYDWNPTNKGHWMHKLFHRKIDPDTNQLLTNPHDYAFVKFNPEDNKENLSEDYLAALKNLSPRYRKRFYEGEAADENPFGLFNDTNIDLNRVLDGVTPEFVRLLVAVDPSGSSDSDNADNDEIGILVGGLGTDGNAYILDDLTVKAGPEVWGSVAVNAYNNRAGSGIVAEKNFGGDMVRAVIQAAANKLGIPTVPIKLVNASRGKVQRAEPISAIYANNKVRHVGYFPKLEDELMGFSSNGYTGEKSPNRADALIWLLTELFPGIVKQEQEIPKRPELNPFAFQIG